MSKHKHINCLHARRKLIIEAAKVCFSRSGFHGGSMTDLIKESGLGAGQIYRFFSSKEALINEIVINVVEAWRLFLFEKMQQHNTLHSIFNRESDFWSGWTIQEQYLLMEIYSEATRNKEVQAILVRQEEMLVENLLVNRPEASPHLTLTKIMLLLVIIDGFIIRCFYDVKPHLQEISRIDGIVSQMI
nr:helix-turn-helix domain-containing protein [Pantoea dispersa]